MPTIELRFPALPGHVRTARMIASTVSRRCGVPDELLDEVKLAVGEACARAVRVNRHLSPSTPVVVQLSDDDDALSVSVTDCGPYDPTFADDDGNRACATGPTRTEYPDPPHPPAAPGPRTPVDEASGSHLAGLDLALIKGLVDDFSISGRSGPGGTVVTLRWPSKKEALPFGEEEHGRGDPSGLTARGAACRGLSRARAAETTRTAHESATFTQ